MHSGWLEPQEFQNFLPDCPRDQALRALVETARQRSRPAISHFQVGAVALGASGRVYLGFNLEFPHLGLQNTVHAEQAALVLAHSRGEVALQALAVSAPPCGHCRQVLRECQFSPLRILLPEDQECTLAELLPHSFGPQDLGQSHGFLEAPRGLRPLQSSAERLAQEAADCAWAPYSQLRAGLALQVEGHWLPGCYLENAAFNPSLNPLQYAWVLAAARQLKVQSGDTVLYREAPGPISLLPDTVQLAQQSGLNLRSLADGAEGLIG